MIVCLDVDGVLRPFTERCVEVFLEHHPMYSKKDIAPKEIRDMFSGFPVPMDYIKNFVLDVAAKQIFLESTPYTGAVPEFIALRSTCERLGHELVIVSSQKNYILKKLTLEWLNKYNMLTDNVVFLEFGKKYLFCGDILIDDEIGNLSPWSDERYLAVCYDRPWNKTWSGVRVSSLYQVANKLRSNEF